MNPESKPLPSGPGPLFPIQETLHDSWEWPSVSDNPVFRVKEAIALKGSQSDTLVSISLFNFRSGKLGGDFSEGVSAEFFDQFILPGPKAKYFQALQDRRYQYPDVTHRIYLAANLEPIIPWLGALGFHQVYLMESDAPGWAGHLWRYMPILDDSWDQVLCTGIDSYPARMLESLKARTPVLTAVLYAQRWMMPFAGPLRVCPGALGKVLYDRLGVWDIVFPMSSYLGVLGRKTLGSHPTFAHVNYIPFCLDAGFLTLLLWNTSVLTAPGARFLERGISEYKGVVIKSILK